MKILKGILMALAVLIVLVLLTALFVNKSYTVQRQVVIQKPAHEVFQYVRFLKNQDYYNKWVMADPQMKKDFKGQDGREGFVYAWAGNKQAGKREQEITRITENDKIDTELRFKEPFEGIAKAEIKTVQVDPDKTTVIWTMRGANKYPMNFMNLFTDKMLGDDLQASLNNLKQILEN